MEESSVEKDISRSLEHAFKSSMDVQSLNNLVSSLRIPVKKAKVGVTHRLTALMKKFRNKKGSETQMKANQRKADRLGEEISVIKKLNLDKVAKFALGNTYTVEEVGSAFKNDTEMKAMVRLSTQKALLDPVKKWRQEHKDWQDLAAYIIQHTGRRFKPKETSSGKDTENKPKFKHQQKTTKLTLSSKFSNNNENDLSDQDSSYHSDSNSSSKGDQSSENDDHSSSENESEWTQAVKQSDRTLREHCDKSNKDIVVDLFDVSEGTSKDTSKSGVLESEQSVSSSVSDNKNKNQGESATVRKLSENKNELTKFHSHLKQTSNSDESDEGENISSGRNLTDLVKKVDKSRSLDSRDNILVARESSGEMVVKKLNLDELADAGDEDIAFVFKSSSKETKAESTTTQKRNKPKSDFFITGDEDEDSVVSGESDSNDETEDLDEDMMGDAKRAMYESTFLGSLAGPAPKYRDYASYRKEKKTQKKEEQRANAAAKGKLKKGHVNYPDKTKSSAHVKGNPKKQAQKRQHNSTETKPVAEEKLHPSWEASKKRKIQQTVIPSFQGKKKTFDD